MQSLFLSPDNTTGLWEYRYRATPDGRPIERYRKVGPFDMNDPEGSRDRECAVARIADLT